MTDPNIVGRSGTRLTEVRSGPMRVDGTQAMKEVYNPYLDGKKIVVNGKGGIGFRDGVSTGFGPSKLNANMDVPELNDLEYSVLMALADYDVLNTLALQQIITIEAENADEAAETWKKTLDKHKFSLWCHRSMQGWTLMAEGRRVAELLIDAKKKK